MTHGLANNVMDDGTSIARNWNDGCGNTGKPTTSIGHSFASYTCHDACAYAYDGNDKRTA